MAGKAYRVLTDRYGTSVYTTVTLPLHVVVGLLDCEAIDRDKLISHILDSPWLVTLKESSGAAPHSAAKR
jgi:hypothetical protein